MKKIFTFVLLSMIAFNAVHAEITWTLSDDGTLTISGTDMPDFNYYTEPYWNSQKQKIKKIVLKNGVTKIGSYAFYNCNNLTSITIPNSVTSIRMYAFEDCLRLTSITIPNSVTSIGDGAFEGCSGLTSIIVEEGSSEFDSRNNCNAIIRTKSNSLIAGCKNTVIPNSVTRIEGFAFHGCTSLTSITIPNSVTSIGHNAFSLCTGLTSITIPNSVTEVELNAFGGTKWYNRQPDGLVYAGLVLYKYKGTMPTNTIIVVNGGTKGIAAAAFASCVGLTSITIPNSVTSIGSSAFSGCSGLTSITIPNSVTSIGYDAFRGCSGLTSITIPNSVTNIGQEAFRDCSSLSSIIVEEGNSNFDSRNKCNAIIEKKSNRLILGCKNTIVPNSVTSIGSSAFSGCSGLTSITIPNSVTSIRSRAFDGCSGLTSITCEASTPPNCYFDSFNNVKKNIPIYVPAKSIDAYKKANGWKDFTNIQAIIIEPASIAFANASEDLIVGITKKLEAVITPEDATTKTITWTSSNTDVATVSSEGIVTAKVAGTTVITATTNNGKAAKCTITVKQPVTAIALSETATSLWVGKTKTLTATATPSTASNTAVNWSSSNNNVATISSKGVITAKGKGTCTITCTAADGYGTKSTCEVTVKQQVKEIVLSETTVSLLVGDTKTITATATPTNANNTNVTWSSSDNSIATVSSKGIITAKGKGTCTITCTATDGYGTKSTCEVTVKQQVTEIVLSETTTFLWVGETKTITATATPTTASNTSVNWSSSDDNVVSVSSEGVITANGEGTCIITCTAADGYGTKSTCEVTVKQQVAEIALSETTASLWVGDTKTITATASPTTASNTSVEWSSSDDNVATVSSDGVITAKGEGTCTITCTASDGYGTESTCKVNVKQQVTKIALSETTASLWVSDTKTITATASPTTASNTSVTWSSSDDNVATVSSDGVITAKGKGTCIITCTAADGYGTKTTCEVTVKQQVTEIALSETTASLWIGDTKTLTATVSPTTASNTSINWTSSDDKVASVSSEGVITANGEGTCTITCTAADGYGTSSNCEIIVMQKETSIEEIQIVNEDSPIYNLNGQRINHSNAQKGVYIKNGKKYAK